MTTALLIILLIGAALLAFGNGANDNAKGVATLIAGGTMRLKPALIYAAVTTAMGSVAAVWLGAALAAKFKGSGIVDDVIWQSAWFPACVGIAAATTVLAATRLRMPISTTHAMVGAIMGIGIAAHGLQWASVWGKFFLPLLVAPVLALMLAAVLYLVFRTGRRAMGITGDTCVCVDEQQVPVTVHANGSMVLRSTGRSLTTAEVETCRRRYGGRIVGVSAQQVLDTAHILSAGAVSFARGLNDTPKIAALLVGLAWLGEPGSNLLVGLGIVLGGLLAVRRVAETMSYRIVAMNDGQAFTANLTTAILVIFASKWGVPVSTTHVSCGGMFGIGVVNRRAQWGTITAIVGAWVTTLPVAGVLGFVCWRIVGAG